MGEVVHGDYRNWVNPRELQAVTNYEAYKGIYSSLNSHNLFEIAYTFNRQFGAGGLYRDCRLYNFVDNHDVNRLASQISNPAHLQLAYTLLFSMPGMPSIYYGSEFGVTGAKNGGDEPLRPALDITSLRQTCPQPDLLQHIQRLAQIYHQRSALRNGDYREMLLQSDLLVFLRQDAQDWVLIAINSGNSAAKAEISLPGAAGIALTDLLDSGGNFSCVYDRLQLETAPFSAMLIAPRAA
jgi:glycosidase